MVIALDLQGFKMHPSMKIGYVSLNVPDLQKSLDFYQSILGFKIIGKQSGEKALLAADSSPYLVELLPVKNNAGNEAEDIRVPKRAGLYHFAVLLPERKFLADMLVNLNEKRDRVYFEGMADHLVSESIYIRDPDFNGIEIYCDRPRSEWSWEGGRIQMATERLDIQDLLKDKTDHGWKGIPAKTVIGHMHLHVSNLAKTTTFYSEILGLNLTCTFPGAHFFAADKYHHHVAANTWLGEGVSPAAPEKVGLNHFGIALPAPELDNTVTHLESKVTAIKQSMLRDPDGIKIRLYMQ
jgi:catechol 2,3-dioxygenase